MNYYFYKKQALMWALDVLDELDVVVHLNVEDLNSTQRWFLYDEQYNLYPVWKLLEKNNELLFSINFNLKQHIHVKLFEKGENIIVALYDSFGKFFVDTCLVVNKEHPEKAIQESVNVHLKNKNI
jgi:hypothetical protein